MRSARTGYAIALAIVVLLSACSETVPSTNAILQETHGRRGNQSDLAHWHAAAALFANDDYWQRNQNWIVNVPVIDSVTGEQRLDGQQLLLPAREDRAAMVRFDNWYAEELTPEIMFDRMIRDIPGRAFIDVHRKILDPCGDLIEPKTRECPTIQELVAEIDYVVDRTGPIEWEAMSIVLQEAFDPPAFEQIQFLPGYAETVDPFDDDGNGYFPPDDDAASRLGIDVFAGELFIPDYRDREAAETFAGWFDETFLTDPESPFYTYVEKPAQAYRDLLHETLEFCEDEPDLCGKTTEELDRTE